jgi:dihydroorotate dehydrogenase (fumarate)
VHTAAEVAKYLLAGADVTMTTSSLLMHGPGHLRTLVNGLAAWMEQKQFASVAAIKGAMSQRNVADASAFERANYLKILSRWRQGAR